MIPISLPILLSMHRSAAAAALSCNVASPLRYVRKLQHRLVGGPHMLMHWRGRAHVLDAIFAWLDQRGVDAN